MEKTAETNGGESRPATESVPTEVKAEAKEQPQQPQQQQAPATGKMEAPSSAPEKSSASANGNKKRSSRDRSKDRQTDRDRHRRAERSRGSGGGGSKGGIYKPRSRPECRVYISNIPYEYRWQDLKDLFRNEVGEVSFVELFEDESGKPRGCGIVEFEKLEHARKALDKMNGYELKGRRLVVKEDFDVERDGYGRLVSGAGGRNRDGRDGYRPSASSGRGGGDGYRDLGVDGRGGGGAGTLASRSLTQWSDTYGLSPQFLDSLGISGPLYRRVFVANLDYKVDDAKLREVFQLAGKVVVAEVTKDRDGRSRGFGIVEFDHPVESVQAISMFNNQMLFDRRMTVRMDRDADRVEARSSSSSSGRLPDGLRSIGMGLGDGGNPIHGVASRIPPVREPSPERSIRLGGGMGMSSSYLDRRTSDRPSLSELGMLSTPSGLGGPYGGSVPSGRSSGSLSALGTSGSSSVMVADYSRTSSNYSSYSPTSNGNGLLGSGLLSSNYGYSTSGSAVGGSTGLSSSSRPSALPEYERRDVVYDSGYRTGQQSQSRDRPDYRTSSSSAYDLGTRMAPIGSSVTESTGGSSRISDTVVVSNLPSHCTWQDLRDTFCEVGDVLFADIRSNGNGLVRFGSERDAQRACNLLNRSRMDGQTIEVDFY